MTKKNTKEKGVKSSLTPLLKKGGDSTVLNKTGYYVCSIRELTIKSSW